MLQDSGDPSISNGSAGSVPPPITEEAEKLPTGSDWIRTLQHHTPDKPSGKQETRQEVESAKKKAKK